MVPSAIEWIQAQLCESSNPGGFNVLPGRKGLRMRPCVRPLLGPKRARSMPTLAVRSSNSGLPDQGRENRKATGPSSCSGAEPGHSFVYGFAKSQRANVNEDEEDQFKEAAKHVLGLTEKQLAELLKRGGFVEVTSE